MTNTTFTTTLKEEVAVYEVLYKTAIRQDSLRRQNFGIKVKDLDSSEVSWINCYNTSLHNQVKWGQVIRVSHTIANDVVTVTGMTSMQYIAEIF